jgi:hypothetical protein
VPTRWGSKGRLNLICTLSLFDNSERLEVREFASACSQTQVIAYLETLAEGCDPQRLTLVVLDNALFHRGAQLPSAELPGKPREFICATYLPTARNSTLSKVFGTGSKAS